MSLPLYRSVYEYHCALVIVGPRTRSTCIGLVLILLRSNTQCGVLSTVTQNLLKIDYSCLLSGTTCATPLPWRWLLRWMAVLRWAIFIVACDTTTATMSSQFPHSRRTPKPRSMWSRCSLQYLCIDCCSACGPPVNNNDLVQPPREAPGMRKSHEENAREKGRKGDDLGRIGFNVVFCVFCCRIVRLMLRFVVVLMKPPAVTVSTTIFFFFFEERLLYE